MEGENLYTTKEGQKVYSTERQMTPEEREDDLRKQQDDAHAWSLFLLGKGPNPHEKKEENKDNVTNFPKAA